MPEFSTASVPLRQKFDAWRHVITQQFLPLRPEPVARTKFRGEVHGGALDSMPIAQVCASGQVVHRAGREISQSSPDALFVNVHVAGSSALECGVEAHRMSHGDVFFVDGHRPFRLHCEEPMHHVVVAIPMDRLRNILRRPELAAGAVVQRGSGVAALLSDYLISVGSEYQQLDATAAATAARHVAELVAHTLNERHAGLPLPRNAVRAALHARAWQVIEQDLGDPLLSPARIAKRLNVSVRFLHALFREHGTSVMRQVYERRVRSAAAMFGDPAYAHRSITDIAMSCGFSDLTHFGRVFSQAYQETPRSYRARSR
jgi:AraC family transcriptional regulator, positive regulator of tynA and feaB